MVVFKEQKRRRKASDRAPQTVSIAAAEACYPANQSDTAGSQSSIDVQRKQPLSLQHFHIQHMHQLHIPLNTQRKNLSLTNVYINVINYIQTLTLVVSLLANLNLIAVKVACRKNNTVKLPYPSAQQ